MRNRSRKLDRAHTLSSYLSAGNLNAAAIADFSLISYSFILTAVAFPILLGSENLFAEKSADFGL